NYNNIVSNIINNPATVQTHINTIVNLVVTKGYDGIDIDYENLNGSTDRAAYSSFITNLASALHAQGKILTTDVYGKTAEPGNWSGQIAQDYTAIGNAADEVRIMLYDYNPGTVGPIAPYSWIDNTLTFAESKMPSAKIVQGMGIYGYDWLGTNYPTTLDWTTVQSKISTFHPTVTFDTTNF